VCHDRRVNEIVAALAEQQDELSGLIAPLDDAGWARPSACEGWSIADVVLHLAQTNEMAVASATGTLPAALTEAPPAGAIDDGAGLAVARERGASNAELLDRWRRGAEDLRAALLACDPSARLQWVAGTLAARTLATTRLAETWIHTGDVLAAFDRPPSAVDRLRHIARLAHRTLPYAFSQAGLEPHGDVAFRLTGPSGDAWDFGDDGAPTVIRGSGYDLCRVASRRVEPSETGLSGEGPDVDAVLAVVRTWA
jgi:uncharacterized protein (TIGR03084 family)